MDEADLYAPERQEDDLFNVHKERLSSEKEKERQKKVEDIVYASSQLSGSPSHRQPSFDAPLPGAQKQKSRNEIRESIRKATDQANWFEDRGYLDRAETKRRTILREASSVLGGEHDETLLALHSLGRTLAKRGKFHEAERIRREVLDRTRQALGEDHRDTLVAISNLANTLRERGKFEEAERMQRSVVDKTKVKLGEKHPDTLSAINHLVITLHDRGKMEEAESLQRDAVEKTKQVFGEEHLDTFSALYHLATILAANEELHEATRLLQQLLEDMTRVLGEDHIEILKVMSSLADMLNDQGPGFKSMLLYEQVLGKYKRILGDQHRWTLRTAKHLGALYRFEGRQEEAAQICTYYLVPTDVESSNVRTLTDNITHSSLKDLENALESACGPHGTASNLSLNRVLVNGIAQELLQGILEAGDPWTEFHVNLMYNLLALLKLLLFESQREVNSKLVTQAISFIFNNRGEIIEKALGLLDPRSVEDDRDNLSKSEHSEMAEDPEQMSIFEKFNLLAYPRQYDAGNLVRPNVTSDFQNPTAQAPGKGEPGINPDARDEDDGVSLYARLRPFLFQSKAFVYLLARLNRKRTLAEREGMFSSDIKEKLHEVLGLRKGARVGETVEIEVQWDPFAFIDNLNLGLGQDWKQSLTITGSAHAAQMATIQDYVEQNWPLTGQKVLTALDRLLQQRSQVEAGKEVEVKGTLDSGEWIQFEYGRGRLLARVKSAPQVILDIFDQFAWLGSSCHDSTLLEGLNYVSPSAKFYFPRFYLDFALDKRSESPKAEQSGLCWTPMFDTMPIANNFPILRRYANEKGIEIPLAAVAEIGYIDRITLWNGSNVLKGFSTMFVPARVGSASIQWHFICDEKGDRLSYIEADKQVPDRVNVSLPFMKTSRHFVGWVSSASLLTGTSDIDYHNIGYGGRDASAGIALEKISLSASYFVGASATFTRGKRSTPAKLQRTSQPYECELDWAQKQFVVLFDADSKDRRGWLVDGASALLHMCLAKRHVKPFSRSDLLRENFSKFVHADPANGFDAALIALEDETNLAIPIFPIEDGYTEETLEGEDPSTPTIRSRKTTKSYWTFKDLVKQTCDMLQQARDHQISLMSLPDFQLRFTNRDKLFGFRFKDMVEGQNPLIPRFETLQQSGRGWVDLTRKVFAINLIGKGFGDLIVPANDRGLCERWKRVPKEKDYLATTMPLLEQIWDRFGDADANPFQLASNITWRRGAKLFEPCTECSPKSWAGPCDRIQSLLPPIIKTHKRHPGSFAGCEGGAVVFGQSDKFPFWFPKASGHPPKEGTHEDHEEDEFEDSGVGTSVGSGSTT